MKYVGAVSSFFRPPTATRRALGTVRGYMHGALQTCTKHVITANMYPEVVYMLVSVALDYQGLADYNTLLKLDSCTFPVSI